MNRRQFLHTTPMAAAAALSLASCTTPAGRRFRMSTSSIHFKSLPVEQACERIAALGYEAVDLWSAYEQCPHLDDIAQRLGGAGLREMLGRHRLKLFAFSTYVGGYAKYAKLLGEAGGGVAIQGSAGPCPPAELTVRMRTFFEGLKPLAELAERHHSWLAIENHGHALLDGPDSFKAFVDLNPFPRVGLALAPYHLQALGASVPDTVRIADRQLLFFYAWQNAPGVGQLPGHGPTDFRPWLEALGQAGYRGYLNPFMHGHLEPAGMEQALATARKHLQSLL
jgi:sugar phosphate isomerase/epimerase